MRTIAVIGEAANRTQKDVAWNVVSNTIREDLPSAVESGQKSVERAGEMHQADGKTQ